MVAIVTLSWLLGLALLTVGYVLKERALACERAKINAVINRLQGGAQ
jgi:hypothetical protein